MEHIPKETGRPMCDAERIEFIRLFVIGLQDELNHARVERREMTLNQAMFTEAIMIRRADKNGFAERLRLYKTPQGPRSRDFRRAHSVAYAHGLMTHGSASAGLCIRVTAEHIRVARTTSGYWDIRGLARAYARVLGVIPFGTSDEDRLHDEFDQLAVDLSAPEILARLNADLVTRLRAERPRGGAVPRSHDHRRIRSAAGQEDGGGHG